MKKHLLLPAFILAAACASAQTPRLSLYEEFTGETCPPCASTNPGLDALLMTPASKANMVFIKWQVPIPSAPSNTWSLYQTNKTEINWRYKSSTTGGYGYPSQFTPTASVGNGINSAPTGLIDGQHQWKFGANGDHPFYLNAATIDSAHQFLSPFSVVLKKEWNTAQTAVNVTVQVVASMNYTATGALVFRTVMIESLVQFSVQPGTNGEKTFHNPVIASFPSIQAGTPLPAAWVTGQSQTFTMSCTAPAYTRNKNQVDMVGFIQDDGNREIQQAVRGATCTMKNITVSSTRTNVCVGETVTITASGASMYRWNDGQFASSIVVSPTASANYWVMSSDTINDCRNTAALALNVSDCTGLNSASKDLSTAVYPNPNKGQFVIKTGASTTSASIVIFNGLGQKVFEQSLDASETTVKTNLAKGLYYYQVMQGTQSLDGGKLLVE